MTKIAKNRDKILQALNSYGKLSVREVVDWLGVSEVTVRRFFGEMERDHQLLRICGGTRSLRPPAGGIYSFGHELKKRIREKQQIGTCAANLIAAGDRIFLDSGTTVRSCAVVLRERLERNAVTNLLMITNSLAYTDILAASCPVFLTGGRISPDRMELMDADALSMLSKYHFTKALFGTDAITDRLELMTNDENTARLVRTVVANSDRVIILADSSKIGRRSFTVSAKLDSGKYTLVTDSGVPGWFVDKLRQQGIDLIVAGS